MRDAVLTGGNALPKDDPPDVTRFKAAAAKRLQAHRWRRRMALRCLTVRVNDRTVRHLIGTGYLSLDSSKSAPMVAIALEAWIYDNLCLAFGPPARHRVPWPIHFGDHVPGTRQQCSLP